MAAKLLSMRFCIRSYHAIFSERERERETNLRRHSKRSTACLSNRVECVKTNPQANSGCFVCRHEALAALRKHRRTALAVESPIFLLAYTPVFDVLKSMHCPSPASSPLSEAALLSRPFQNVILKGGTAPSEDAAKFDEVAMQCGIMERLDESQREAFFVVSKNEFIVVQGSGEPYFPFGVQAGV